MNKFAKFFVVFAMALCLVCVPAFAATSMSNVSEITDAVDENGEKVEITVEDGEGPILTEVIAAAEINAVVAAGGSVVGGSTTAEELQVLWQKSLHSETLPVTISFHEAGTAGLPLYVFHWNGASWDLMASANGEDISATFDSLSPVGIVVKKPQNNTSTNGSTSDKTGTTNTSAIALAIAMAAGAAAVVTYRKKVSD